MSYSDLEKNDVSSSIYHVQDLDFNNNVLSLHSEYFKYNIHTVKLEDGGGSIINLLKY